MKVFNIHDTGSWFQVMETTKRSQTAVMTLAAGNNSSEEMNVHDSSDQALLVVEGEVRAEVDGKRLELHKGDSCTVPAGTPHRFENRGESPAVTFNVYSPPEYGAGEQG
jgi:mannose-6-phosphate isomerase-like protein (cupin superfamily)